MTITRLSQHLEGVCALEAEAKDVVTALRNRLERFGPVDSDGLEDAVGALDYLLPLASFASRYVVAPSGGWTLLLCNAWDVPATHLLLSLSKALGCRGTSALWGDRGRTWIVRDSGALLRAVNCIPDGTRWQFHTEGEPLSLEDTSLYALPRAKDRLPSETLVRYVLELVGDPGVLDVRSLLTSGCFGLTRSVEKVRHPITEYDVVVDV